MILVLFIKWKLMYLKDQDHCHHLQNNLIRILVMIMYFHLNHLMKLKTLC